MLQTVGKFGLIIGLSSMGLLGFGWKAYAIVGGVVLITTIILLIQSIVEFEPRNTALASGKRHYSLKLEALYITAFGIAFGALWPALPLIAVFGTDGTDVRPDPSGP